MVAARADRFSDKPPGPILCWERGESSPSGIGSAKQLKILKEK